MYTNVWLKYLPALRIVLKKSMTEEQVFRLNAGDFERVGLSRKSGYKFNLQFRNGKVPNIIIDLPVATSLATVLTEDQRIMELFAENEFHISMNGKFELTITHFALKAEPAAEAVL
ncbi:MAG TPA: hypothetical protein VEX63_02415 [Flavisolibacter sp.]|jgi:hypothetical protein|nr:hypothetical protein [Flavisolibacter sp.]